MGGISRHMIRRHCLCIQFEPLKVLLLSVPGLLHLLLWFRSWIRYSGRQIPKKQQQKFVSLYDCNKGTPVATISSSQTYQLIFENTSCDTRFQVFHNLRANSPRVSGGTGERRGSLQARSHGVTGVRSQAIRPHPRTPWEPQESLPAGYERPELSYHILRKLARMLGLSSGIF